MRKTLWISALLGVGALMTSACGEPDPCETGICVDAQTPDAGPDMGDAQVDGGFMGDAGPCPLLPGRAAGAACASGDRCNATDGLTCATELAGMIPATNTVAVLPDGGIGQGRPFPFRAFEGGSCVEGCDPDAEDTCGDCSTCNGASPQGSVRFPVNSFLPDSFTAEGTCRDDCTPSQTGNGGCREGYTCDIFTSTCVEACLNTTQCEFSIGDPDGNGEGDIVDNGAGSGATCNDTTGRCNVPGTAGANAGDPCAEDSDCEDNGFCLDFDDDPDGYCSRIGCAWPGFECNGTDEVCDTRSFGDGISACLEGCTVGAETTTAQRRGAATGGNPTCRDPGSQCVWNGNSASTDPLNGSCLPGNYNDTPAYNVGEPCLADSECFSPFGYGRCLFLGTVTDRVQSGICVIGGCAGGQTGTPVGLLGGNDAPVSLPTDVQPEVCDVAGGDLCVGFGGGATFCLESCTSGAECAPGYGCMELLTGGGRLCWPGCEADVDCATGNTCRNTAGAACGTGQECYCSNAMPATDAGTPAPDAGTPDAGTPEADAGTEDDAGEPDAGTAG